jgi:hypothetical protein
MKVSQLLFKCVVLASASLPFNAIALEAKSNTLLYISPMEYSHSVHLLSPYYDYWFEQGPIVEPIALEAFKASDASLAMCTANEKADTVIRLKPRIFYNPQMQVYHSKFEATVYSGSGEVIGSYSGEAQQQGYVSFDNATKYHIKKAYGLAMQDLMRNIKLEPVNLAVNKTATASKLPCGLIGAQAEPVFNFY